ncbi:MAG: T9SS type A sorting domain-containing protein [Taibaiella sp.]|nr:T9SS type A sorting domain-containing protein [Taibaiella sp.]
MTRNIENVDPATYGLQYLEGFGAGGSSGSGMFDNDRRLIGIASTAIYGEVPHDSCLISHTGLSVPTTSNVLFYAKLSYCWENPSLSSPTDAQKLKPWLDPTGSGATQVDGAKWNCEPLPVSSVSQLETSFDGDFNIYPNPSADGNFQMNIRMNQASYAQVQVYDITGKTILSKDLGKLQSQIVNLDLTQFTSGMYMVRISNQYGQITKKVVINK